MAEVKKGRPEKISKLEDKKAILDECIQQIAGGFEKVRDIYAKFGVALPTVHRWVSEMPEYQDKLADAKSVRAIGYVLEGKDILDNCEVFYTSCGAKRDSMASVTKAKAQADMRFKFAGALDPGMWGEMAKEVRDLQKEIRKLQEVVKGSNAEMFGKITQITAKR